MKLRKLVMIGSGFLAASALSVLIGCGDEQAAAAIADETVVKQVVSRGELLMAKGGATADYAPTWRGGPMAPDVKANFAARVARDFNDVFSPTLASDLRARVEAYASRAESLNPAAKDLVAADVEATEMDPEINSPAAAYPIVRLEGGVDNVHFGETSIAGDTATVTATVEAWATVAQVRGGKTYPAHPRNTIVIRETLQRQGDKWTITDRQWDFAPGGGP